jgi:hypothetical protein
MLRLQLPLRDAAAAGAAGAALAVVGGEEGESMVSRILSSGWSRRGGSCALIHSCNTEHIHSTVNTVSHQSFCLSQIADKQVSRT